MDLCMTTTAEPNHIKPVRFRIPAMMVPMGSAFRGRLLAILGSLQSSLYSISDSKTGLPFEAICCVTLFMIYVLASPLFAESLWMLSLPSLGAVFALFGVTITIPLTNLAGFIGMANTPASYAKPYLSTALLGVPQRPSGVIGAMILAALFWVFKWHVLIMRYKGSLWQS